MEGAAFYHAARPGAPGRRPARPVYSPGL